MIKVISLLIFILLAQVVKAQNLFKVKYNKQTGAIEAIQNKTDRYAMNFVYESNKNSNDNYKSNRWGLGPYTLSIAGIEIKS